MRLLSRLRPTLARHLIVAAVAGVVLALLLLLLDGVNGYQVYQATAVIFYAVAAAGLTLLTGLNGQLSLGHGALMAVGGYTAAVLLQHSSDLQPAVVMLAAVVATAAVSLVVGTAAARLRGPYLAGATLALALSVPGIAVRFSGVFGGDAGLRLPTLTAPDAFSSVAPEVWAGWVSLAAGLVAFVLLANLTRTRYGRDFRAIRDDEVAAALHGIQIARTQVLAFVLSGASAGLAGALYAYWANLASPSSFSLNLSLTVLAVIVIGGLGTLPGAIWGSIIIVFVPSWISSLNDTLHLPGAVRDQLPLALYGAVFAAAMLSFPHGLQGGFVRFWYWRARFRARAETLESEAAS